MNGDNASGITIKISNPSHLPLIDYRTVKPLQGDLKDLTDENYTKLKNVLIKRGFKVPLFLWKINEFDHEENGVRFNRTVPTYFLMDGHQRQRVMIKENMDPYEVPYVLIEADTLEEAKLQLLEISSQYGTITVEGYDEFTAELPELDLQDIYFDKFTSFSRENEEVEEDEPPEVSSEPAISKLGEIYQLGKHRLMCGDSLDFGQISDLINGDQNIVTITDPPYNVGIAYGAYDDNKTIGEFVDFTQKWLANAKELSKNQIFFIGNVNLEKILAPLEVNKENYHIGIWYKGEGAASFGYITSYTAWEPIIFVGEFKRKRHTDVFTQVAGGTKVDHPVPKPISLMTDLINNFTNDENILDLFSGSGSALIACEQLNRTFYGMEIDPKYCDVIRKRYWKFTHDNDETGWEEGTPNISNNSGGEGEPAGHNSDSVPTGAIG